MIVLVKRTSSCFLLRIASYSHTEIFIFYFFQAYDDMLDKIILSSTTVIAEGSCENIVPDDIVADAPLVLYIAMSTPHDHDTWLQLAKCWKLWDLDVRGYHKG